MPNFSHHYYCLKIIRLFFFLLKFKKEYSFLIFLNFKYFKTNDRKHSFSSQTTAPICNTRSTSTIRPAVYFPVDDYSQNCNCRCCRQRKRKERFHLNVKTNLGQICEADYVQRSLMTIDESQESDLMGMLILKIL